MEREDPWDENDGEELEAEIMRADHAFGMDLNGTTPEEAEGDLSMDRPSPASDPVAASSRSRPRAK